LFDFRKLVNYCAQTSGNAAKALTMSYSVKEYRYFCSLPNPIGLALAYCCVGTAIGLVGLQCEHVMRQYGVIYLILTIRRRCLS